MTMIETLFSQDFSTYTQWSGILTLFSLVLAVVAFVFGWGFRFRLVGITGFMIVLTIGLFGLSLGLFDRVTIPNAVRYALVYDNGGNQAVISVPQEITATELEATLEQAAYDLFSYGRGGNQMSIRARVLLHPEPGLTKPVYVGEVRRSLATREDENLQIDVFPQNLAKLSG